jgi:pimeloyl-ACP methyl ester carboxylesterase
MGGMISQMMALQRPTLIKTLTLISTQAHYKIYSFDHFMMQFSLFKPRKEEKERMDALLKIIITDDKEWLDAIDMRDSEKRSNREILYQAILLQQNIDGVAPFKTLFGQLLAVLTHKVSPSELKEIGLMIKNVKCITGNRDNMIHHSASEYIAKHVGCELVTLDKKGHILPKEAEHDVIKVLEQQLRASRL